MTRPDLIDAMHDKTGLTKAQCASACDALLEAVGDALRNGERVSLTTIGSLAPQRQKPRRTRHPSTGEMMTIPARVTVKFRPSRQLQEYLTRSSEL